MSTHKKTKAVTKIIIIIGCIIFSIFIIMQCSSDDDVYSATCKVCNKTYTYQAHEYGGIAQRNVMCIRKTNMCLDCYEIYCWSIGKTPEYQ